MIKSDVRDSLPLKYQPFDNNLFTLKNLAAPNSRNSLDIALPKKLNNEPSSQDISDAYAIGSF